MSNRISRRDMLKNVGVASAAGALLTSSGVPLLAAGAQNSPPGAQPDHSLEQSSLVTSQTVETTSPVHRESEGSTPGVLLSFPM